MYRQLIAETSGHTFLLKFRNGLQALDAEIDKLETITADLDYNHPNLPRTYFQDQLSLLNNIDVVLNETEQLHQEVFNNLIDIDHVENRLLNFRERLLYFEEDPKLLSRGYRKFVPKDTKIEDKCDDDQKIGETDLVQSIQSEHYRNFENKHESEVVTECFQQKIPTNENHSISINMSNNQNSSEDSFNILNTVKKEAAAKKNAASAQKPKSAPKSKNKSKKIDLAKIDNPMVARAFTICNRWIKDDKDADSSSDQVPRNGSYSQSSDQKDYSFSSSNFNNNNHENIDENKVPKSAKDEKNSKSVTMNPNFTPSIRDRLFNFDSGKLNRENQSNPNSQTITPKVSVKKSNKFIGKPNFFQDEYETVEFTPGMTTRVRKSSDKR